MEKPFVEWHGKQLPPRLAKGIVVLRNYYPKNPLAEEERLGHFMRPMAEFSTDVALAHALEILAANTEKPAQEQKAFASMMTDDKVGLLGVFVSDRKAFFDVWTPSYRESAGDENEFMASSEEQRGAYFRAAYNAYPQLHHLFSPQYWPSLASFVEKQELKEGKKEEIEAFEKARERLVTHFKITADSIKHWRDFGHF